MRFSPGASVSGLVLGVSLLLLQGCVTVEILDKRPLVNLPDSPLLQARTAEVRPGGVLLNNLYRRTFTPESMRFEGLFAAPVPGAEPQYTLHIAPEFQQDPAAFPKALLVLLTASVFPGMAENRVRSTMVVTSGGQEVFRDEQDVAVRANIALLFPMAMLLRIGREDEVGVGAEAWKKAVPPYLEALHRQALLQRVEQDRVAFDPVAGKRTPAAWEAFLGANPSSFFRGEALRGLAASASRARDPLAAHKSYAARYPDYARYLDAGDALWFVGPAGLQVVDIAPAIRRGTGAELLASQIRAARQPYKLFSDDELALLKRRGVPDVVAAAMMDVTREVDLAAAPVVAPDAGGRAARGGALFATMAAPAAANNMAPAAPAQPQGLGAKVAGGAAECAKAYIAKKACEKIPDPTPFGFAIKACIKKVKQTYGGAGCPML